MDSDDSTGVKPKAKRSAADRDDDTICGNSITDLIDSIERDSFLRNLSSRTPRGQFAPRYARTANS
jgi:hypothetical protein